MTRLPAAPTGELTEQPVLILDLLAKVGLQKKLAHEHGGVDRSWQRAVNEARVIYEREQSAEPGTSP
ncbi:hypothetical protein ACFWBS_53875 [Streptomyces mirabilis]|uniref:hypothetical protein n=1 Tax=Streptomyces mirabilis TaxID=68239 RepID=UPI00365F25D7